jgi:hypothetical protein
MSRNPSIQALLPQQTNPETHIQRYLASLPPPDTTRLVRPPSPILPIQSSSSQLQESSSLGHKDGKILSRAELHGRLERKRLRKGGNVEHTNVVSMPFLATRPGRMREGPDKVEQQLAPCDIHHLGNGYARDSFADGDGPAKTARSRDRNYAEGESVSETESAARESPYDEWPNVYC